MAQWAYGYGGHTHDTKVLDAEESLRLAISAHSAAPEGEREHTLKAAHHLAERLLAARRKALRVRIARLSEPDMRIAGTELDSLRRREQELEAQGVEGILQEFGFHGTLQV